MLHAERYWRLSPNVMNNEQSVDSWKEAIREGYAIMGDREGKEVWDLRFRDQVQKGDIILIARRRQDGDDADLVGFGIVASECLERLFPQTSMAAYYRNLMPFKPWTVPQSVKLPVWPRGHALQQLDPESSGHKALCEWMKKQLDGETARATPAKGSKYGCGGESPEHRKLKGWCAQNPQYLGLSNVIYIPGEMEYPPCGENTSDLADVFFTMPGGRFAVVEVETDDPKPGAYQALKYKTLLCAYHGYPISSDKVQAILVAWKVPEAVRAFCQKYGIEHFEKRL